ncbi:MAG: hypothetical protein R3E65_09385 [Steroidobacteraceae bacterium]
MLAVFKTLVDIALLRRDPSALPASSGLLGGLVVLFLVLNLALSAMVKPQSDGLELMLFASVAFSLLWYWVLLRLFQKPERYLQTVTAIVGFGCLMTPLLVPLSAAILPFVEKPEAASPIVVLLLPVVIYIVFVTARILMAAIERPMFQAVALVLLHTFLEPLVLSLFGGCAPAGS